MLKDSLSIAGSIASITGVSVLWLRELLPSEISSENVIYGLVAALVGASFSIGVSAGLIKLSKDFGEAFGTDSGGVLVKTMYWGIAGPILLGLIALCLGLVWEVVFSFWSK